MIAKHRVRRAGLFVLCDAVAISASWVYTYLFRFYANIIPVDPAKGIPRLSSYLVLLPLLLAVHLGIFPCRASTRAACAGPSSTISCTSP